MRKSDLLRCIDKALKVLEKDPEMVAMAGKATADKFDPEFHNWIDWSDGGRRCRSDAEMVLRWLGRGDQALVELADEKERKRGSLRAVEEASSFELLRFDNRRWAEKFALLNEFRCD